MTVLTRGEFALLLSHVQPLYQPLVLLLVATGLRWGEATALTPGDLDLFAEPPTLRVTKAWKRDGDRHWYVGPPKTKRARRTVALPDELVDVLMPLAAGKPSDALLFTNTVANRFRRRAFGLRLGHPLSTRRPTQGVPTARRTLTLRDLGDAHECTTCGTRTRRG